MYMRAREDKKMTLDGKTKRGRREERVSEGERRIAAEHRKKQHTLRAWACVCRTRCKRRRSAEEVVEGWGRRVPVSCSHITKIVPLWDKRVVAAAELHHYFTVRSSDRI